jgi:predicted glycoside hydrolase/deacetylase ChbG (UPF0249 family)
MRIWVQADDLALGASGIRNILAIQRDGRLDRVSLLPNGEAFRLAVSCLRDCQGLGWSSHLNLVEGRSLCSRQSIPLLVDRRGCFRRTFVGLWLLYWLAPWKRLRLLEQIEKELSAQIRRAREAFPQTTLSVDSHQHVHLLPFVFRILLSRAGSWGIERIRIAREPFLLPPADIQALACLFSLGLVKHFVLRRLSRRCLRLLPGSGVRFPDYLVGVLFSGRMSLPVVRRALRRIALRSRGGNPEVELVFHPALHSPRDLLAWKAGSRSRRFYSSAGRAREMNTLLSKQFAACLERAGRSRG